MGRRGERDQAADRLGYARHEVPQIDLDDLVAVAATRRDRGRYSYGQEASGQRLAGHTRAGCN